MPSAAAVALHPVIVGNIKALQLASFVNIGEYPDFER